MSRWMGEFLPQSLPILGVFSWHWFGPCSAPRDRLTTLCALPFAINHRKPACGCAVSGPAAELYGPDAPDQQLRSTGSIADFRRSTTSWRMRPTVTDPLAILAARLDNLPTGTTANLRADVDRA